MKKTTNATTAAITFMTLAWRNNRLVVSFSDSLNKANSLSSEATGADSSFSCKQSHGRVSPVKPAGFFTAASAAGERNPLCCQIGARKMLLLPQRRQSLQVLHGGAAHL